MKENLVGTHAYFGDKHMRQRPGEYLSSNCLFFASYLVSSMPQSKGMSEKEANL
jgi:hypothetical protein